MFFSATKTLSTTKNMQSIGETGKKQVFHFFQYRDFPVRRFFEKSRYWKKWKISQFGDGQKTGFEKIPGTRISKNLGTGRKYQTFFDPFFGSIFVRFLPLLTKRSKNGHFWKKPMCIYLTSLFFRTPKSRSVGR